MKIQIYFCNMAYVELLMLFTVDMVFVCYGHFLSSFELFEGEIAPSS